MPNYDFHCPDCNHEFEELVALADREKPRKCPKCGKKKVTRKVTAVKVNYGGFKDPLTRAGSGWNDLLTKVKKGSGRVNTIRTR